MPPRKSRSIVNVKRALFETFPQRVPHGQPLEEDHRAAARREPRQRKPVVRPQERFPCDRPRATRVDAQTLAHGDDVAGRQGLGKLDTAWHYRVRIWRQTGKVERDPRARLPVPARARRTCRRDLLLDPCPPCGWTEIAVSAASNSRRRTCARVDMIGAGLPGQRAADWRSCIRRRRLRRVCTRRSAKALFVLGGANTILAPTGRDAVGRDLHLDLQLRDRNRSLAGGGPRPRLNRRSRSHARPAFALRAECSSSGSQNGRSREASSAISFFSKMPSSWSRTFRRRDLSRLFAVILSAARRRGGTATSCFWSDP